MHRTPGPAVVLVPAAAAGFLFDAVHHRGQLSVYLRLRNVPLPPIYGPSADEQ